jgi:hypothetical protein
MRARVEGGGADSRGFARASSAVVVRAEQTPEAGARARSGSLHRGQRAGARARSGSLHRGQRAGARARSGSVYASTWNLGASAQSPSMS